VEEAKSAAGKAGLENASKWTGFIDIIAKFAIFLRFRVRLRTALYKGHVANLHRIEAEICCNHSI